ncbi:hypothetical protein KUL25_14605 [Rhodobacteraceae bacterium N5(2021)]|uniref:DUF2007 domain-containing protein n=1 Tax=Gymnodinialimonas phycosphaerae TaxID=2841589 RepID=A0A975YEU7_9RHOB|nr:hypothetical protein [Gymnodinialimonas phycosphaerae]MBY4893987.1 hypothetical protein [Gymnodinialimonas phycosphaerae]
MSRYTGFTRVAASFDTMEIRMAVAALEGADFTVIAPGMQMTDTLPMNALAFGPMEIYVIDPEADEAAALLQAIASGTVIPHDQRDLVEDADDNRKARRKSWISNLFGFLLAGVSAPLKGLSVDRKRRD